MSRYNRDLDAFALAVVVVVAAWVVAAILKLVARWMSCGEPGTVEDRRSDLATGLLGPLKFGSVVAFVFTVWACLVFAGFGRVGRIKVADPSGSMLIAAAIMQCISWGIVRLHAWWANADHVTQHAGAHSASFWAAWRETIVEVALGWLGGIAVVAWSIAAAIMFVTFSSLGGRLSEGRSAAFVETAGAGAVLTAVLIARRSVQARRVIVTAPRATVVSRARRAHGEE
ncbi:MAG: hypothetical protein AB7O24_22300 [Kofleriaceae bacterium]